MSPKIKHIYCQLLSGRNAVDHVIMKDGLYEIWIVVKGTDLTNCVPAVYKLEAK